MFTWLRDKPVGGSEYKAVELAIPQLKLGRSDWEGGAGQVFPGLAKQALERMTVYVVLQMDEADRLYQEDIISSLRGMNRNLKVVTTPQTGAFIVKVRRLQFDERQLPDSQQTVMYQDYQVDTMKAVLLMPRNATYAYDVISGGAELVYGFLVKVELGGKFVAEEVIRDRITRSYSTCRNQRIQNVFGGIQPAEFVANDDQQRRCSGSGSVVRIQDLRGEAIGKVASKIAATPAIAQNLNQ